MSKVKRVATIAFGQGINVLVNFMFLPYMARALSISDYGTYGQVLLVTSFASALLASGLSKIIYVYLAREPKDESTFDSNLITAVCLGLIGAILLGFTADLIGNGLENEKISDLLKIFTWSIPFQIAYQSIVSKLIFVQRVKEVTSLNIGANLLKVTLVVLSIQLYSSLTLVFWSMLLSVVIQTIVALLIAKGGMNFNFNFNLRNGLNQLKKGLPLGLTGLLGTGILYIDGLMVSKLLGLESYAIYRNGALEVPFIATIYSSIAAIVLPEVSKLFSRKKFDEIFDLKRKVIMNTIYIIYPILVFLLFFSSEIITVYLGERYAASAIIFSVFNLTLLIRINDYSDILLAASRSRQIFKYYLIAFIINIVLNVLFIRLFGSVGAALATVLSIAFLAYLQLKESMTIIGKNLVDLFVWKRIIHMLLVCGATAASLYFITYWQDLRPEIAIIIGLLYFPLAFGYLLKKKFYAQQLSNQILGRISFLKKWV